MSGTLAGLRALAGDALIAIGEKVRGGLPDLLDADYDETFHRHTAAAGWTAPAPLQRFTTAPSIAPDFVRAALDELPDSELINVAATLIAGWKPILLSAVTAARTDIDLLVDALRDRASQFRAVERDADEPFPARLTNSVRTLPE